MPRLLGVVVVNLAKGQGPWMFYTPVSHWLAVLLFSLLAGLLSASGGILVSLHSATVRQAQQTLLLSSLGAVGGDLLRGKSAAVAADPGDELFPDISDRHAGSGCNRRHLAGDFAGQLPPLALDFKLTVIVRAGKDRSLP